MKILTPYNRLLNEIKKFCYEVQYPEKKNMWLYSKSKLHEGWNLLDLYERTAAAEQLGYDVILKATEQGLEVEYQAKRPKTPWKWE